LSAPAPRIAVFLHCLEGGGAERISVNLATEMAHRGLLVDMVLVQGRGTHLSRVPPNVRVVDLQCRRHLTSLLPLVRYLRREQPQVLLSALTHTNLYALAARHLARVHTRVVIRINNTITEELRVARGLVARVIRPWGVRLLYRQADGIIAVSHGAGESLRDAFGDFGVPVEVIPNPVVVPELYEQARQPLEHPWFLAGAPPVLLTLGRLVPQKDLATLILAFALVRHQARARLLIFGEGEERPRLERLILDHGLREDVQLPGFVSNPFPYMAAARGVILSSRYEGAPSVLVEALALGTPVASTDCPSGPREMLRDGRWGRLVPVGAPPALAEAMLEILRGSPYPLPGPDDLSEYHLDRAVDRYLGVMRVGDRASVAAP
jgi:glycosyltransferase involved in cell wall biosynthesis